MKEKALVCWSGGKDSALALYEAQQKQDYEIAALLTTITDRYARVSMHGVREELLDRQCESLGIPVVKVRIAENSSEDDYRTKIAEVLARYRERGAKAVVFGDIFLEEVRNYREENLSEAGMEAVFPLWGRDTGELAETFIDLGFKAVVTCVDSQFLGQGHIGRSFDRWFLAGLPPDVDPCGENGEFHSFVYDGPPFGTRVAFRKGEIVLREERFWYCDLVLAED
jgi:uncharacterized protein (TIGR00290 family)